MAGIPHILAIQRLTPNGVKLSSFFDVCRGEELAPFPRNQLGVTCFSYSIRSCQTLNR